MSAHGEPWKKMVEKKLSAAVGRCGILWGHLRKGTGSRVHPGLWMVQKIEVAPQKWYVGRY